MKVIQRRQLGKSNEKPHQVTARLGIIKQTPFSLTQIINFQHSMFHRLRPAPLIYLSLFLKS